MRTACVLQRGPPNATFRVLANNTQTFPTYTTNAKHVVTSVIWTEYLSYVEDLEMFEDLHVSPYGRYPCGWWATVWKQNVKRKFLLHKIKDEEREA